jgi:glycerate kinase
MSPAGNGPGGSPADGRSLTVLFSPDSFKGSLTSVEVARALATGWMRARPDDRSVLAPLADGGEGTLVAIEAAGGWEWREAAAHDPIGTEISARWLQSSDGSRAAIELAAASGLSRLRHDERDPHGASTRGTGEVIRAALDAGVGHITFGIGGSATTDGGEGLLRALAGAPPEGEFSVADLDPRLREVDLQVACDVTNPLLGSTGAAATYGPQKGASPTDVAELDQKLAAWADKLEAATGRRERDTPGAGAAGGVGFGLLAVQESFRSFALRSGVDLVMEAVDFDAKVAAADLVLTGEGRIDAQTAFGKTALGVARRARAAGIACIAVGGGVEPDGIEALAREGAVAVPILESPQTLEAAMAAGTGPIERCAERIGRLLTLGLAGLARSSDAEAIR